MEEMFVLFGRTDSSNFAPQPGDLPNTPPLTRASAPRAAAPCQPGRLGSVPGGAPPPRVNHLPPQPVTTVGGMARRGSSRRLEPCQAAPLQRSTGRSQSVHASGGVGAAASAGHSLLVRTALRLHKRLDWQRSKWCSVCAVRLGSVPPASRSRPAENTTARENDRASLLGACLI